MATSKARARVQARAAQKESEPIPRNPFLRKNGKAGLGCSFVLSALILFTAFNAVNQDDDSPKVELRDYSPEAFVRTASQVAALTQLGVGDALPKTTRLQPGDLEIDSFKSADGWVGWLIEKDLVKAGVYSLTFAVGPIDDEVLVRAKTTNRVLESYSKYENVLDGGSMGMPFILIGELLKVGKAPDSDGVITFTFNPSGFTTYDPSTYHWGWMPPNQVELQMGYTLRQAFKSDTNEEVRTDREEDDFINDLAHTLGVSGQYLSAAHLAWAEYRFGGSWEITPKVQKAIDEAKALASAGDL